MARVAKRGSFRSGGDLSGLGGGTKDLLEFSFTQRERDSVLTYCSLREDIKKRFRKMVAVGSDIVVAFDRFEAREMTESLSEAAKDMSEDGGLNGELADLLSRFELKRNHVFPIG